LTKAVIVNTRQTNGGLWIIVFRVWLRSLAGLNFQINVDINKLVIIH